MRRFFLIVLDGCGCGELPDALDYGVSDLGSNTLGNTAKAVGGVRLPTLGRLGLGNIAEIAGVAPTSRFASCVTPDETAMSHRLFTAAIRSHAECAVINV